MLGCIFNLETTLKLLNFPNADGKEFAPSSVRRCRTLSHKHGAYVQHSAVVNSTHPFHTFYYVQGSYYLRLSLCHNSAAIIGDNCVANMRRPICSQVSTFIGTNCLKDFIFDFFCNIYRVLLSY